MKLDILFTFKGTRISNKLVEKPTFGSNVLPEMRWALGQQISVEIAPHGLIDLLNRRLNGPKTPHFVPFPEVDQTLDTEDFWDVWIRSDLSKSVYIGTV